MRYVVVENTPGYLPEEEDPATFETFAEAEAYAYERAAEACDAWNESREDDMTLASVSREHETLWRIVSDAPHDLGRVVEILPVEDQVCRDCGESFPYSPDADICPSCVAECSGDHPDEEDDYISETREGYAVSRGIHHLDTFRSRRRAEACLYLARVRSGYWPNVWYVNERGNVTLCVFDSHVLRFTETAYV